jgi:hypothetical protein
VNIVIFNWPRPLGRGLGSSERSGRDEPMWVVIHMCMEARLGISLYSYLHLKLTKMLCLSYYLLGFLFNKIGEQEGRTGSARKWGEREDVAQTMYTHASKCKNDKIKRERKKERNDGKNFPIK